ncbi:MAG TPA: PHP domain-containing protein [Methanosarcinales archaeon]|nr:PHP domain-containing protein [Methanosarcinales archaeon]
MRIDLHIHSCYSKDCASPVESILKQACSIGLDGIAICDHDTIEGSLEAQRLVKEHNIDLVVVPGVEVTTTRGHLLVLGNSDGFPKNKDPQDIIRLARAQDCLIVAPHPYKGYPKSLGDVSDLDVDAIEVLNSRFILGKFNERAVKMARTLDLPMLGNSDAHFVGMVGRAYTEIDAQPSVEAVFKAIMDGNTVVHGTRTPLGVQFYQACLGVKRRMLNLI